MEAILSASHRKADMAIAQTIASYILSTTGDPGDPGNLEGRLHLLHTMAAALDAAN